MTKMVRPTPIPTCLSALLSVALTVQAENAAKVTTHARAFTIETPRLAATFEDGLIVAVRNLRTGEVHADSALKDHSMPRGMGHIAGQAEAAAKLHGPWGTKPLNPQAPSAQAYPTMHRPNADSRCQIAKTDNGARATWTGLTNGKSTFPEETLTVEAWVDADTGALLFRGTAQSSTPGVYGVQVPLANLHPEHEFYLPSFGGVMYDRDRPPALITLSWAPFWEAPAVGIQGNKGSLGLWVEDAEFHPNFCFFNWSGKSFSLAIEHLDLMPFEPHTRTQSVVWRLEAFDGGWVDAMTPYKQWYAKTFAQEMEARAAVKWADRIRVIIDHFTRSEDIYRWAAETFDPDTVIFHDWNARAPVFDQGLPDWTPRKGYVEQVKAIKKHGFKTMAYVNSYCVNYNSPVFKRDKIETFGLTRRIHSFWRYTHPHQTFDTVKDGQLLYLDPLSPGWRKYHTDMMVRWREDTGTDANYEDTAGHVGDCGNGVVDGKFAAQGGVELVRELLRRNPSVPMASEYGPDAIAFGVRWPLRFQQVWGTDKGRVFWMRRQRPVSAYIHGPLQRPWIPVIRAESNFSRHVIVACSDALGGMAQFAAVPEQLQTTKGIVLHMKLRAQLFSREQLVPYFTRERCADGLACMYKDKQGRVYKYFTDANTQAMIGPDGKPIYQRITGVNRFATNLALPGWPAYHDAELIGLNPTERYALASAARDRVDIRVCTLPNGIKLSRFYETQDFAVLGLDRIDDQSPKQGSIALAANVRCSDAILNARPVAPPPWQEDGQAPPTTYETPFPCRLLFVKREVHAPAHDEYFDKAWETRHYVTAAGLDRGGQYMKDLRRTFPVPGEDKGVPFTYINLGSGDETTFDMLVRVPSDTTSLKLYLVNTQTKYGDGAIGRLYLNGKLVHERDLGTRPNPAWKHGMPRAQKTIWPPSRPHQWLVPLGHMAGKPLLVTLATDAKTGNNADLLWWSQPMFVSDPAQKPSFVELTKEGPIPEE